VENWLESRAYYLELAASSAVTLTDFYFYVRRRPIRQLAWFRVAQLRVQRAADRRDLAMAALFAVAIALAICKLVLVAGGATDNVDLVSVPAGHGVTSCARVIWRRRRAISGWSSISPSARASQPLCSSTPIMAE
jgi:hypothetical protein